MRIKTDIHMTWKNTFVHIIISLAASPALDYRRTPLLGCFQSSMEPPTLYATLPERFRHFRSLLLLLLIVIFVAVAVVIVVVVVLTGCAKLSALTYYCCMRPYCI